MAGHGENGGNAPREMGINTVLSHAGLSPREFHGFVNPPIVRASTVLFESVEAM